MFAGRDLAFSADVTWAPVYATTERITVKAELEILRLVHVISPSRSKPLARIYHHDGFKGSSPT